MRDHWSDPPRPRSQAAPCLWGEGPPAGLLFDWLHSRPFISNGPVCCSVMDTNTPQHRPHPTHLQPPAVTAGPPGDASPGLVALRSSSVSPSLADCLYLQIQPNAKTDSVFWIQNTELMKVWLSVPDWESAVCCLQLRWTQTNRQTFKLIKQNVKNAFLFYSVNKNLFSTLAN